MNECARDATMSIDVAYIVIVIVSVVVVVLNNELEPAHNE